VVEVARFAFQLSRVEIRGFITYRVKVVFYRPKGETWALCVDLISDLV
jgi:hypothetical protein